MNKKYAMVAALIVLLGFSLVPLASHNASLTVGAMFKENIAETSSQSLNWAGYVITSSSYSVGEVSASWIVPNVSTGGNSYAAFWVGIDGYNDNTVEQTGILAEPSGHGPHSSTVYEVWYEFYPASPVYASYTASPGDIVYATVSYSTGEFTTSIAVYSSLASYQDNSPIGPVFTHTQAVSGALDNSAEWIVEAPSSTSGILPLANFGTAYFGSDYTGITGTDYATVGGVAGTMGSFNPISITMVSSNGSPEATPSAISSDGTSFSVTYDQSVTSHGHAH
ncbi:MAG: G1 family glutamic endopeptidase [Thermoplasmata archaeon]